MLHNVALEAAEALIAKKAATIRNALRRDPEYTRRKADLAQENAKLARHALSAGALDIKQLDALVAKRAPERRDLVQQAHDRAIAGSGAAAERLRALTPPPIVPADSPYVVLDEVTFIRSFLGTGVVSDSAIAPGENSAQYHFNTEDPGTADTGRLSFFTLWQNTQHAAKVVTVDARLIVNAGLYADCDGSGIGAWFGINGFARATVHAQTTITALWNSSLFAVGSDIALASVSADGGFFGEDDSTTIEFNDLLPAPALMVPRQNHVLIEVELLTDWQAVGKIKLDAESGGFRVSVPSITLTLT